MQGEDCALRRCKIAAALGSLGISGNLAQRAANCRLSAGIDRLEQSAAHDLNRTRQQFLQQLIRKVGALADREREDDVLAGALDQRGISTLREKRPRIRRAAPDDVAITTADDALGEAR